MESDGRRVDEQSKAEQSRAELSSARAIDATLADARAALFLDALATRQCQRPAKSTRRDATDMRSVNTCARTMCEQLGIRKIACTAAAQVNLHVLAFDGNRGQRAQERFSDSSALRASNSDGGSTASGSARLDWIIAADRCSGRATMSHAGRTGGEQLSEAQEAARTGTGTRGAERGQQTP